MRGWPPPWGVHYMPCTPVTKKSTNLQANGMNTRSLREAPAAAVKVVLEPLLRHLRVPPERQHFIEGTPAQVISRATRDLGAQILVMGTMARSGLKRVLIGNTAEQLLEGLKLRRPRAQTRALRPPYFGGPTWTTNHHFPGPVRRGEHSIPAAEMAGRSAGAFTRRNRAARP